MWRWLHRIHERFGSSGAGNQRIDTHIHGQFEAIATGEDGVSREVISVSKGN